MLKCHQKQSRQAFLTVSGQLQVETYACAIGSVYTFGPTFRAEHSHTSRRLAEFWMVEPEIAFAELKDDPEVFLEGVAMSGLVGVLCQLIDLAEFAVEIFHDLHEEVMTTAARGHGLTVLTGIPICMLIRI